VSDVTGGKHDDDDDSDAQKGGPWYEYYEPVSGKIFKSDKTFKQYIGSRKYKKLCKKRGVDIASPPPPVITRIKSPAQRQRESYLKQISPERIDPEEWDLDSQNHLICPFDDHEAESVRDALIYLYRKYGFVIPYEHCVKDIPTLLRYYNAKVSLGHIPLSRSVLGQRPSRFETRQAVQAHMQAKKDFKVNFQGNEMEYSKFYDLDALTKAKELEPKAIQVGDDVRMVYADGRVEVIEGKKTQKLKKLQKKLEKTTFRHMQRHRQRESDSTDEELKLWKSLSRVQRKVMKAQTAKAREHKLWHHIKKGENKNVLRPRTCPMYRRE